MPPSTIPLTAVDEVKVTILVDNSLDLLIPGSEVAERFLFSPRWLAKFNANPNVFDGPLPYAEHGFSALITVRQVDKESTVLFDTGVTPKGLLWNMDALEVDPGDINAIVLSHGHPDHAMGLPGFLERLGSRNMPLVLHPGAYLERKLVLPDGIELGLASPKVEDLRRENIELIESVGPSMLLDGMILVSGEISRKTDFEQGFAIHHALRQNGWGPDPLIMDDQCAIVNVREIGLVIVTGCGHSGVINTIRNAQQITGVDRIHAVIGGFHLSGAAFEPLIPATIAALKEIKPRYLMPGHCTGWVATHQIARAMPEAFLPNSLGTRLTFTN
jgi:7,8-dihydropterin-6-yl-methyl-4-(beta-D-ribofuranosyl)aminobenzene 5'-phosphate synthase